jgi:hypothetical protein
MQEISELMRGLLVFYSAALLFLCDDLATSTSGDTQRIPAQFTPSLLQPCRTLPADAYESFPVHPDPPLRLMRHENQRACIHPAS